MIYEVTRNASYAVGFVPWGCVHEKESLEGQEDSIVG